MTSGTGWTAFGSSPTGATTPSKSKKSMHSAALAVVICHAWSTVRGRDGRWLPASFGRTRVSVPNELPFDLMTWRSTVA
jgi:hypothetical protein